MNKYLFFSLRPRQWLKNTFIFLPLLFSGKFTDMKSVLISGIAFVIYSMIASSVYLYNDIVDVKKDRKHPVKKLRPVASGKVSLETAGVMCVTLALVSLGLSVLLGRDFFIVGASYIIFNVLYSRYLKNVVIIDVMCIAFFFLLRVLAGCYVIDVSASYWLFICTVLISLFLGFIKRRQEIVTLSRKAVSHREVLGGYSVPFLDQMIVIVATSTITSYTLYTVSDHVVRLFGTQSLLLTVPFVYYGVFRYLFLVHKRGKGGEPERIIVSDKSFAVNLLLWAVTSALIVYFKPQIFETTEAIKMRLM